MSSTMTRPLGWLEQRPPSGSSASDLLEREELLQLLDRAISKRITVVSAPPGSGKTSLLRAWADRSTGIRRVAFTSVDRDERDAQRFWSAVLDALGTPARSLDRDSPPAASAGVDGDQLAEMVRSELAEVPEPVVLIVDDLHELRSTEALRQLGDLLAVLPGAARVVLETGDHPALLKDAVTTPAGCTIDGIMELEEGKLRVTLIKAVVKAVQRAKELAFS